MRKLSLFFELNVWKGYLCFLKTARLGPWWWYRDHRVVYHRFIKTCCLCSTQCWYSGSFIALGSLAPFFNERRQAQTTNQFIYLDVYDLLMYLLLLLLLEHLLLLLLWRKLKCRVWTYRVLAPSVLTAKCPVTICHRVEERIRRLEKTFFDWLTSSIVIGFLKNVPTPASFSFIFHLFKQTSIQFLEQFNVKNVNSIQYMSPGFEPTTSRSRVISHNH